LIRWFIEGDIGSCEREQLAIGLVFASYTSRTLPTIALVFHIEQLIPQRVFVMDMTV
jgi:hypothetical protein